MCLEPRDPLSLATYSPVVTRLRTKDVYGEVECRGLGLLPVALFSESRLANISITDQRNALTRLGERESGTKRLEETVLRGNATSLVVNALGFGPFRPELTPESRLGRSQAHVRIPMMPQYARYKATISSAEMTAAENQRTLRRIFRFRANHKERALATEATPKATVEEKTPRDQAVGRPSSLLPADVDIARYTIKLRTANKGHTLSARSAGRRRLLIRPPKIQNGA